MLELWTYFCSVLYIGLAFQKQVDNFVTTLKAGERERRVAIGLYLSIDVTSHVQQESDSLRMTVHGSQHQGRDAQLTARPETFERKIVKRWVLFQQRKLSKFFMHYGFNPPPPPIICMAFNHLTHPSYLKYKKKIEMKIILFQYSVYN